MNIDIIVYLLYITSEEICISESVYDSYKLSVYNLRFVTLCVVHVPWACVFYIFCL